MFGVTTTCVTEIVDRLRRDYDCLVFHATGTGGRTMEKLADSGLLAGVIDITTTEVCDLLFGGVLPATEDRFGAIARTRVPYVGSVGALDMVNFWAPETVPAQCAARLFYKHNPNVTLMRTTAEECRAIGEWIGEKLNACEGPVRFLIPEKGVSALDIEGGAFWDPEADAALFSALEARCARPTPPHRAPAAAHQRPGIRRGRRRRISDEIASTHERTECPDPPRKNPGKIPRHDRARPADRRRRRRHRPFGQGRGGRRHRPDHHLQFRPLPHGRARLGCRACSPMATPTRSSRKWPSRCCRW